MCYNCTYRASSTTHAQQPAPMAPRRTASLLTTDVFLAHDWGVDEQGRSNHARVSRINDALQRRGITTWFDDEQMDGQIIQKMSTGIDNAAVVLVFVTERYCVKVNGPNRQDNCQLEFAYAAQRKGASKMIACTMENRVRDPNTWAGMVGMVLGGDLYVDMVSDAELEASVDKLVLTIRLAAARVARTVGVPGGRGTVPVFSHSILQLLPRAIGIRVVAGVEGPGLRVIQ